MVDFERMFGLSEPALGENQESEHDSFGDKMGDACCGMVFGFILFIGCLVTSGWNEYRSVTQERTIDAAKENWNQGSCTGIDSALNGKLVHITCPVSNLDVLGVNDPVMQGIPEKERTGLSLESYMEVYQWKEISSTTSTKDKVGGGTTKTTTYTYNRNWDTYIRPDPNSFFKQGETCKTANNGYFCKNWDPSVVEPWWSSSSAGLGYNTLDTAVAPMVGNFFIPKDQLHRIGSKKVLTPACSDGSSTATTAPNNSGNSTTPNLQTSGNGNVLSCSPGGDAKLHGSKLYWQQEDSNNKMIDYLAQTYSIKTADTISILALQTGDTFKRWASPNDKEIYEIVDGNVAATDILVDLETENAAVKWSLRVATLLGCIVGLVLITAPLATLPDIIPCIGPLIGDLIGYVLWAVNCAFGCCCWFFITAICWIVYRPVLGIVLLLCCCLLCAGGGFLTYQNHKVKQVRLKAEAEMAAKKAEKENDLELAEEPVKIADQPVEVPEVEAIAALGA